MARTVLQASRLLGLITMGTAGLVLATAPLIMTVWLGRPYPGVVAVIVVMVITYVVNNLTGVGTTVVSAIGRPRYESEYAVLGMTLNLVATLALAPFYGLYGVLFGTLFGVVACSVYFLWRFHRIMRYSLWEYLGTWLWRVVAAVAAASLPIFGLELRCPTASRLTAARGFWCSAD